MDVTPLVVVVPVDETTVPDALSCSAVFDEIICTLSTVADEIGSWLSPTVTSNREPKLTVELDGTITTLNTSGANTLCK